MNELEIIQRTADFYNQLNLSAASARNYRNALNSFFFKDILYKECGVKTVFAISDLEVLWNLYSKINLHPKNVESHRAYSAALMKYIRYLNNGKKYGRRIDYQRKKEKSK